MIVYERDTEGFVAKALEDLQKKGHIKYVHIDRVKVRNKITRKQEVVRDIYFVANNDTSAKIWFICGVRDSRNASNVTKVIHPDFTHANMSPDFSSTVIDDYELLYRPFCNPVDMCRLWERPEDMKYIIKGNLLEGNPNDRWRTLNSLDMDIKTPTLYMDNGARITSKSTLRQVITQCEAPDRETTASTIKYRKLCERLIKNHSLRYVPVVDGYAKFEFSYKLITEEEMSNPRYWVSDYYRTYSYRDINELPEIPIQEIDVGIFGCGSAGSAILSQMRRLTYFNSVMLIDPDIVEPKNLRNQIYQKGDLYLSKVDACARYVNNLKLVNGINIEGITRHQAKFQEVGSLPYEKFKYLVSGFDSFEARIELLEYIKAGKVKTKYLIDTRYNDLTSSLFFIDCDDVSQLKYYEKVLLQDKQEYNPVVEDVEWAPEIVDEMFEQYQVVNGHCSSTRIKFGITSTCPYNYDCGGPECRAGWLEALKKANAPTSKVISNSCLAQNFIQIYTLTASWVISIIRAIETDNIKPLTHVELGIDPVPQAMVLKK